MNIAKKYIDRNALQIILPLGIKETQGEGLTWYINWRHRISREKR